MYAWKKLVCQGFVIHLVSKVLKKMQPNTKTRKTQVALTSYNPTNNISTNNFKILV